MRSILCIGLLALGCAAPAEEPVAPPGSPLPGLSADQLARFSAGRALFDRDFLDTEGLGPLFNQRRCSSCHDLPTVGGSGSETVAKVSRFEPPDRCELFVAEGGDMLQRQVTPALAALGFRGETVPAGADVVASIFGPPLYGLGLIEAIPDSEILEREDPDDRDGNGIRGRAPRLADGRPGRFGRKLSFPTLRGFVEHALLHEMGLTSAAFPAELPHGGVVLPPETDPAADPEVDDETIGLLTDYVRHLALPERETPPDAAAADSIRTGERYFARIGCADCHVATLRTGPDATDPLRGRTVRLYSDLLLHDLGEGMATICSAGTLPSEWRTAPLAGLRHRPGGFLHDGRAQSLRSAIEAHGGEAAAARGRFGVLSPDAQAHLLRFLGSL